MRPWLVLNRLLVLTHVGMERAGDARGGEDGAEAGVIIAAAPPSAGRVVVSELGRWPLSSRTPAGWDTDSFAVGRGGAWRVRSGAGGGEVP
jgi:hypothetical protein